MIVCVGTAVCPCSELKNAINGRMLTELGELEQNLVYGDMGSAELIKFLQGEWTCRGCSCKGQRMGGSGRGLGRALVASVPVRLEQCRTYQVLAW
jgi:hypothetical protein